MDADVNDDFVVDTVDVQLVAAEWGLTPADKRRWKAALDVDGSGVVDANDGILVRRRWRTGD